MRPWVIWCMNHHLRWLVLFIVYALFPLYFIHYMLESYKYCWEDFKQDIKAVEDYYD